MFKNVNKKILVALFGLGIGIASASTFANTYCAPLQCMKEYRACKAAGYTEDECLEQRSYCNDICFG
jgi:hypothetical protein